MNTEDVLNDSAKEAEKILNEPSKVDEILKQVEEKLETIPLVGNTLADVPLMISMIKSYITKDYINELYSLLLVYSKQLVALNEKPKERETW